MFCADCMRSFPSQTKMLDGGERKRLICPLSLSSHFTSPVPSPLSPSLCLSPPAFSDFDSLDERDHEKNNQLAFDVAEREFGISPCMTGKEMSSVVEPDKLSMVMYLSQFYEMFKDTVPPGGESVCYSQAAASVVWLGEMSGITHTHTQVFSQMLRTHNMF